MVKEYIENRYGGNIDIKRDMDDIIGHSTGETINIVVFQLNVIIWSTERL